MRQEQVWPSVGNFANDMGCSAAELLVLAPQTYDKGRNGLCIPAIGKALGVGAGADLISIGRKIGQGCLNRTVCHFMYFQLRDLPSLIHSIAWVMRFERVASVLASSNHAMYSLRFATLNPSQWPLAASF